MSKASEIIAMLSEQKTCTCPECGATTDSEKGVPCTEVKCPECGAMMRGEGCE